MTDLPDDDVSRVVSSIRPPVARIVLQNPPQNVIDLPMLHQIAEILVQIESNPAISTILITGEGKSFCAGVDIEAHAPDKVSGMLDHFHSLARALLSSKKVLVAAVQGHCLGGGAELAMICDIVITSDYSTWGFPEITLGCFPPLAAVGLAAIAGQKRAAELILTGRQFDGVEAQAIGLANSVVAEHQLEPKVAEVLSRLSQASPAVLALAKKAIYCWDAIHFDKGLSRSEKIYLEELMKTADAQEGIRAYLEKRKPAWKGR